MKLRQLFILLLFLPVFGFSQLVITNNGGAASLAQAIVGSGITVTNATLNSGAYSTATFTYTGANLGIPNGVLLTSGLATDAANQGTYFSSYTNNNNLIDPDVVAISPQAKYDVCLLEFDFIPICDTLHITYVFGSEEYPRYINQYNDVFAMFLSGPNPGGGNYTSYNIATLPNGITPVSIFTVNGGWPIGTGASNPGYYVDNYSLPNSDIAYDGYTVPITSVVAVTPCQSYHMKIAVVDAGNGKYDSGVFIQGNTFTCNSAPTSALVSNEACVNTGSATAVVNNFSGTPTYLWSPGGQTTATISNLVPGNYYCIVSYPGLCTTDSLPVTIVNVQPTVSPMAGTTICIGQNVLLTAIGSGGASGYTYSWTENGVPVNASVNPNMTTTYSVVAIDANGCSSLPETLSINVNPPLNVVTSNVSAICENGSTTLSAIGSGGNGNYSYLWSPSTGINDVNSSSPNASPTSSTTYTVTINDNCGTPATTATVNVIVEPKPTPLISANVLSGCAPLCVLFTDTSVTNCTSATWNFGDGSDTVSCINTFHCYKKGGTFSITNTTTSSAGCVGAYTTTNYITVFPQPDPDFTYWPNPVLITDPSVSFTDNSTNATSWQWSFGDDTNNVSSLKNPQHLYGDTGCYALQLIVKSQYGCVDTLNSQICIEMEFEFYAPNCFTPNEDGINEIFIPLGTGVSEDDYEMLIFDRWGREIFKTNKWGEGWNGKVNGGSKIAQQDTYVYLIKVYDLQRNFHQYTGRISLIK